VPTAIATYDSRLSNPEPLDAAIVLGAATHGDRPSPVFAARLDYARDLLPSSPSLTGLQAVPAATPHTRYRGV
jgi:hypothetical protein